MDTVLGWSVAMPLSSPTSRVVKPMQEPHIDWWKTLTIPAAVIAVGVVLRAAFWPLWERMVQKGMKVWITHIKINRRRVRRLETEVERMDERLHTIEAQQNLSASLGTLHEDVRMIREWSRNEDRRREGSPLMPGGRRKDDPPRAR